MDIELQEIRDFLALHPPFSDLPPAALAHLPQCLSIRYLRRGVPFPPQDADGDYLYIVRRGAVAFRDARGELVEKLGEGGLCAMSCQASTENRHQGLVVEDSLLYLLPCDQIARLQDNHPDFREHFNASLTVRLRRALTTLHQSPAAGMGLLTVTVGALLSRAGVTVAPDTSIQLVARVMGQEGVSSLLVVTPTGDIAGIVTDRDLRNRCVAEALPVDRPVREIMTERLHTLSSDTLAFEALLTMTRLKVRHLLVMSGSHPLGIVTSDDLLRQESANTIHLVSDILQCHTLEALAAISRRLPELKLRLATSGVTAHHIGQALSAVGEAVAERVMHLVETELGPPPGACLWMIGGSLARREQTTRRDQYSFLLLSEQAMAERDGYFAAFAQRVCNGLETCGYPRSPFETMASHPQWRQSVKGWRTLYSDWLHQHTPQSLHFASILADLRPLWGDESLYEPFHRHFLQEASGNPLLLAGLAANVVKDRPPLGFFRHFVLIQGGEHANTFDLKRGGLTPIVNLARLQALAAGSPELPTRHRLRAAAEAGVLSQEGADNLLDALDFIGALRIRHQVEQLQAGQTPDDYLPPNRLSSLERTHLKDALRVINILLDALAQRYQTDRLL
ncbi:CBS domain-containing protein [Gammaproteobacteria bacterium]